MTTVLSFEVIDQAVEQARPTMERLARELWQLADLSLQEVQSARLIMDMLREEGFTITSKGTARVPTAFIAEWGTDRPILGVLVEYDALPGLGNEAVPFLFFLTFVSLVLSLGLQLLNSPRVGEGIIASEPKPLATGDGPASGRWQRAAVSLPAQPEPGGWKALTGRAHAERRQRSNLLHTG